MPKHFLFVIVTRYFSWFVICY